MNVWLVILFKLVVAIVVLFVAAFVVMFAELKVSAHMQSRIGPYYCGGRWGWAHVIAEVFKWLQKEDLVPAAADGPVFRAAPMVSVLGMCAVAVVIPLSPTLVGANLDVGIFYALAAGAVSTVAILMAGWSSGNKFSLLGGLRAGAQLIAYELPLVLAVVGVVIQAGTMSMVGIVEAQSQPVFHLGSVGIPLPYVLQGQIVGFVIFMIAALAELVRIPFDMPVAESELVMGYLTEYTGIRFTMFLLAEYGGMVVISAIASVLFLGGYYFPGLNVTWFGPFVLLGKALVLTFVMIWFRWTWPRFREDQLQSLAWRWLVPIALVNIAVTATLKVLL
ncbi:MAG TPA: complex I subunit 1 family protein [Acidimicrobiia bacterium]|nr:complex I subunit 1 family protein [Acidimicrobiia bacterium]